MNKQEWKEKEKARKDNEIANLNEQKARLLKEKNDAIAKIDSQLEELTYHKEAIEKLK